MAEENLRKTVEMLFHTHSQTLGFSGMEQMPSLRTLAMYAIAVAVAAIIIVVLLYKFCVIACKSTWTALVQAILFLLGMMKHILPLLVNAGVMLLAVGFCRNDGSAHCDALYNGVLSCLCSTELLPNDVVDRVCGTR